MMEKVKMEIVICILLCCILIVLTWIGINIRDLVEINCIRNLDKIDDGWETKEKSE